MIIMQIFKLSVEQIEKIISADVFKNITNYIQTDEPVVYGIRDYKDDEDYKLLATDYRNFYLVDKNKKAIVVELDEEGFITNIDTNCGYNVMFENDDLCFYNTESGNLSWIYNSKPEDGEKKFVSYRQYNPRDNYSLELRYAVNGNHPETNKMIYSSSLSNLDRILFSYDCFSSSKNPFKRMRDFSFHKVNVRNARQKMFVRTVLETRNGNCYASILPHKIYQEGDLLDGIQRYGFETQIPKFVLDVYNNTDPDINKLLIYIDLLCNMSSKEISEKGLKIKITN
jgi:hypothetical protein